MREIPLRQIPNQSLQTLLGGQNCALRFYSRLVDDVEHLFCDLAIDQSVVFAGVICQQFFGLKLYPWWPFAGSLVFVDMQGDEEPNWRGLGERWRLFYIEAGETLEEA